MLEIVALGQKGSGIAYFDDNGISQPVFVERALPNEIVRADIQKSYDEQFRAEIIEIVQPAAVRQSPPCVFYDQCGGCQMQHMQDDFYKTWTLDNVRAILHRFLPDVLPEIHSVFLPPRTRRRATFAALKQNKNIMIGYHKRRSKLISDIPECLVLRPEITVLREQIKPFIARMLRDSRVSDIFLQYVGGVFDCVITGPVGKKNEPDAEMLSACADMVAQTKIARVSWRLRDRDIPQMLIQKESIYKQTGALRIAVPPLAFLQPSAEGENTLVDLALKYAPDKTSKMADLFSGHGTFTGHFLQQGFKVDSFESDDNAVNAMKKAGHGNSFKRDLFKQPLIEKELKKYDFILLDPPRAGAKEQCAEIAKCNKTIAPILHYISCNPSTFARDAARLVDGGYKIENLYVIDQFIWSTHCEIFATFKR